MKIIRSPLKARNILVKIEEVGARAGGTSLVEWMENLEEYKWIEKNYDNLLRKYRDMYIAVKSKRVIAHGKDKEPVLKDAEKTFKNPVIYFMTKRLSWKELDEIFEDIPEDVFIQGFRRTYKKLGHI